MLMMMIRTLWFQSRRTFARADLETVVQIPLCKSGGDCDGDDEDCDDDEDEEDHDHEDADDRENGSDKEDGDCEDENIKMVTKPETNSYVIKAKQ